MGIVQAIGKWSAGAGPLYQRLTAALRAAIERGDLPPGTRLPPERVLARALTVSRSTIVAAYDQLRAEGLLESRQGSGTWVPGAPPARDTAPIEDPPFRSTEVFPAFRMLLEGPSGAVSLTAACGPGLPMVAEALAEVAREETLAAVTSTHGYAPLGVLATRAAVAEHLSSLGLPTSPSEVLITSGAQQAIEMCASLLLRRGDGVVLENPTYPGAIDAFSQAGARAISLPVDRDGASVEVLREVLVSRSPRAIFLVPTFQNPTGTVMPEHRRRELAAIVREHRVPLIEDTTLAALSMGMTPPPPVAAFAGGAPVLTIGSMSKLFWGGLRVGWIRAPEQIIARLARVKTIKDLGTSWVSQAVAARLLPRYEEAQRIRQAELISRHDLARRLIRDLLPDWRWDPPAGGPFLWARLPHGDADALARVALRHGVEIVSGSAMTPDGSFADHVRLPLSAERSTLEDGLRRLAAAWEAYTPVPRTEQTRVGVLV